MSNPQPQTYAAWDDPPSAYDEARICWQRMLAQVPTAERLAVFQNDVCTDAARLVGHGAAEKQTAVDDLKDIALNHDYFSVGELEQVERIIGDAFAAREAARKKLWDDIRLRDDQLRQGNGGQPEPPTLPWINTSNWDNEPMPKQRWAVLNRIPLHQCVLFSGEGAAGKSTVELHRSVAHVLGKDWLGSMPEKGPAIHIEAEDGEDVIHYRLAAIAKHYQVTFADLTKGGLYLMSLAGQDAVLATVGRSGKIERTTLYKQLLQAAGDIKPKSISIASLANVFAGDEINRSQVQQFINLMTHIGVVADGSLVLVSHPSIEGIRNNSGISGSTQWHNGPRARYYMKSPSPKPDEQPDSDLREIVFKKNQYGPMSESITLRYRDGMFLPVPGVNNLDKIVAEQKANDVFLRLLSRFENQNLKVSYSPKSNNYAPKVFQGEPEAKQAGISKDALTEAMAV